MYLLDISESYSEIYWFKYDQKISPDHLVFISGEEQSSLASKPTFRNNKKISKLRLASFDLLQSDTLEFASAAMADVLSKFAKDVQLFPADVYLKEEKLEGYCVFNVIQTRPCIDLNNSLHGPMFSFMPEGPMAFTTLQSLPPAALGNHHIVRAEESSQRIFVSQQFKQQCEASQLKGLRFVDCSEGIQV
ncbi:imm11 family protein [Pseudomonas sp. SDO524_S393]